MAMQENLDELRVHTITSEPAPGRPPESFRPIRNEIIQKPEQRPSVELVPGIQMDCLVGQHNGARLLTTGLVSFAPGAHLPYHTHPHSESITVLSGEANVTVEGRQYELGPLDNIVVPRGLAHTARNASNSEAAHFHVAFPSACPTREWVDASFKWCRMPQSLTGVAGRERVTRFATAPRSQAGPGTSFIDYFNEELIPGLEMSGGYGAFGPGGRLPAHFHDFDESICIIQGTATCVCEGRRHTMADYSTALQPRGRVHFFINEGTAPMAMIWVYAGPRPDRLLAEEQCATVPGIAWPA